MSVQAAKEFIVELIDDEQATARADQAYRAALRQLAAEKGFEASADESRAALRELKGMGQLDDREVEVSGFGVPIGRDSLYSMGGSFETLGFLR